MAAVAQGLETHKLGFNIRLTPRSYLKNKIASSDKRKKCFQAKTCLHDGKEKCGENKNGKLRRFLDVCDMKEYNCLRGTDYSKVPLKQCQELPPIPPPTKEEKEDVENKEKSEEVEDESQDEIQPREN